MNINIKPGRQLLLVPFARMGDIISHMEQALKPKPTGAAALP